MILRKMKVTEQLIIDYIDGVLTPEQSQFVLEQLEADAELMASYQAFKETDSLLQAIPPLSPSKNFSSQVMSAIETESIKKYEPAKFGSIFFIPLAILGLTILAILFQSGANASESSSLTKYLTQHSPELNFDLPIISTFKNYSYVLLLVCGLFIIDAFFRGKKVVVSVF